jgi:hypothetical protein
MTEPELVVTWCEIQRRLERCRRILRDHSPRRPELHLVRRRRHRHFPHRPAGDNIPRLQVARPAFGISRTKTGLDTGEGDDDQRRHHDGGKVAANHPFVDRAPCGDSAPPLWGRSLDRAPDRSRVGRARLSSHEGSNSPIRVPGKPTPARLRGRPRPPTPVESVAGGEPSEGGRSKPQLGERIASCEHFRERRSDQLDRA